MEDNHDQLATLRQMRQRAVQGGGPARIQARGRLRFENFVLMHAMGANAAGQVASVVAGGVLLALMGAGG